MLVPAVDIVGQTRRSRFHNQATVARNPIPRAIDPSHSTTSPTSGNRALSLASLPSAQTRTATNATPKIAATVFKILRFDLVTSDDTVTTSSMYLDGNPVPFPTRANKTKCSRQTRPRLEPEVYIRGTIAVDPA